MRCVEGGDLKADESPWCENHDAENSVCRLNALKSKASDGFGSRVRHADQRKHDRADRKDHSKRRMQILQGGLCQLFHKEINLTSLLMKIHLVVLLISLMQ